MISPHGSIPIHCITQRLSLSPASLTRCSIAHPCGFASTSWWETTGLPSSMQVPLSGLDGSCPPMSVTSAFPHKAQRETAHGAVLARASQRLWLLSGYGGSSDLHMRSSYHPSLAPAPDDASSGCHHLANSAPAMWPGVHCAEGFAPGRCRPRTPR